MERVEIWKREESFQLENENQALDIRFYNLCRGIYGKTHFRTLMCMYELYMVVHELSLAHV